MTRDLPVIGPALAAGDLGSLRDGLFRKIRDLGLRAFRDPAGITSDWTPNADHAHRMPATLMCVQGRNQSLWPLLVITGCANHGLVVSEPGYLVPDPLSTGGSTLTAHLALAATLVVMIPPIVVVVRMPRWFIRGLIGTDPEEGARWPISSSAPGVNPGPGTG